MIARNEFIDKFFESLFTVFPGRWWTERSAIGIRLCQGYRSKGFRHMIRAMCDIAVILFSVGLFIAMGRFLWTGLIYFEPVAYTLLFFWLPSLPFAIFFGGWSWERAHGWDKVMRMWYCIQRQRFYGFQLWSDKLKFIDEASVYNIIPLVEFTDVSGPGGTTFKARLAWYIISIEGIEPVSKPLLTVRYNYRQGVLAGSPELLKRSYMWFGCRDNLLDYQNHFWIDDFIWLVSLKRNKKPVDWSLRYPDDGLYCPKDFMVSGTQDSGIVYGQLRPDHLKELVLESLDPDHWNAWYDFQAIVWGIV